MWSSIDENPYHAIIIDKEKLYLSCLSWNCHALVEEENTVCHDVADIYKEENSEDVYINNIDYCICRRCW